VFIQLFITGTNKLRQHIYDLLLLPKTDSHFSWMRNLITLYFIFMVSATRRTLLKKFHTSV